MMRSVLAISALLLASQAQASTTVTIQNSCSETVSLYDNSATTSMAAGATVTRTLANGFVGLFRNGVSSSATLAEFSVDSDSGKPWYDISIIPPGSGSCTSLSACETLTGTVGFNTAISITPTSNTGSGSCSALTCLEDGCSDAYQYPSDDTKTHACPSGTNFVVTFCPGGSGGSSSSTTTSSSTTSSSTTSSSSATTTPTPTTATPSSSSPSTASSASTAGSSTGVASTGSSASASGSSGYAAGKVTTNHAAEAAANAAGSNATNSVSALSATTTTVASTSSTSTTTTGTTGTTTTDSDANSTGGAVEANTQSSGGSATSTVFAVIGIMCATAMVAGAAIFTIRKKKQQLDELNAKSPRRDIVVAMVTP